MERTTEDFKIYRSDWIPGLGHALAMITFERDRPAFPSTERFFVAPKAPDHVEFQRWEYSGISPEIQSDDSLWKHQLEAIEGALVEFLHENRESLKPLYYDIVSSVRWHEVSREWLFHYNLRNSIPSQLAPALQEIREKTQCIVLQDYLDTFRMKASRSWSMKVSPAEKREPVINIGLLAQPAPQTELSMAEDNRK